MYVLGEKDALGYLEGPRGREKCLERTVQNKAMAEQIEASPGRESNANQDLEAWRSLESSAGYIVATQRLTRTSKPASPGNLVRITPSRTWPWQVEVGCRAEKGQISESLQV